MKRYIYILMATCFAIGTFSSCKEDELGATLFPDSEEVLDPESYTYELDYFLQENYLKPYNVKFQYKMEDIGADMNYNLVPANYNQATDMAVLCKYLWLDVFKKIAGEDFVKKYIPKMIHLIGSPAINPLSGTEELGVSENGLKITLYKINKLNVENVEDFTSTYFLTVYHEFTHIMHQTKIYPQEFNMVSNNQYDPNNWQKLNDHMKLSEGMVTPYACKSVTEDLAETLGNYVVLSPEKWDKMMEIASQGWEIVTKQRLDEVQEDEIVLSTDKDTMGQIVSVEVLRRSMERDADGNPITTTDPEGNIVYKYTDPDGIDGKAIIDQKLTLIKDWLKDSWGIDMEELRTEVQKRKAELDIISLRTELKQVPASNN